MAHTPDLRRTCAVQKVLRDGDKTRRLHRLFARCVALNDQEWQLPVPPDMP